MVSIKEIYELKYASFCSTTFCHLSGTEFLKEGNIWESERAIPREYAGTIARPSQTSTTYSKQLMMCVVSRARDGIQFPSVV